MEFEQLGVFLAIHWPARSPDLSPLDLFLWGCVKDKAFSTLRPKTLDELKESVFRRTLTGLFQRVWPATLYRCELVMNKRGRHIEKQIERRKLLN